jgi:PKD domain
MRALRRTAALAAGTAAVLVAATSAHAGGWVPGAVEPRGGTSTTSAPAIAVSPSGTAVLVWPTPASDGVAVSVRPPGGGWSAPRELWSGGDVGNSPDVAIDAHGGITAAWVGGDVAHATYRPPGGDWGPVQDLSDGGAHGGVSVAVNDGGGAVVLWTFAIGGTQQVEGAIRSNGASTFGLPAGISGYGYIYGRPRAAIDPAGDVAAIWSRSYDPGNGGGARYVAEVTAKGVTQSWPTSEPGLVNVSSLTAGNADSSSYDVRMTADGSAVAMWGYNAGSSPSSHVDTVERPVGSGGFASAAWQGPHPLTTSATSDGVMDLDASGGVIAAWHSAPPNTLFAGYRTPFGALSGAAVSATSATPFLDASPSGDATLVWKQISGSMSDVVTSHRAPGGAFGAPVSIAHGDTSGPAGTVVEALGVGVDDQGNAYVLYVVLTDLNTKMQLQVATYDNAPPAIDAVSVPGAGAVAQALAMSASASDRASAVSYAWSFGDGATGAGAGVAHAYARPGTYAVTVTATDQAGNASSATRTVMVALPALDGGLPPGGGGGGGGGAAKKPSAVPAKATIKVKHLSHGRTRFVSLSLGGVKAGDTITLSCSGGGCTKSLKHGRTLKPKKVKGGKLSLTTYVKKLTLSAKAKLRISIARKSYRSLVITYTMVKGKDPRRTLS